MRDNNLTYQANEILVGVGAKHVLYTLFQVILELTGGSSGGGSINIFTNQATGANTTTVTNTLYDVMKGTANVAGGAALSCSGNNGGAGGTGTVNIGEI